LLAVLTFEPAGTVGKIGGWGDFLVAQDFDQERLLGLHPTHRNAQVHVMEARHATKLQLIPASKPKP
jgi:hypothetical protein